jgi:hypothetical protein
VNWSNNLCTTPLSVQAQYSRLCTISTSFRYNGSLVTWTVVCLTVAKFKPLIWLSTVTYITSYLFISEVVSVDGERNCLEVAPSGALCVDLSGPDTNKVLVTV